MTPRLDRPKLGWNRTARGFLILWAGGMASVLAWASSEGPRVGPELPAFSVDANTAPAPVLGALPGLGPVLAGRIVEAREARPFRSIDDFDRRIRGIGPAKIAGLRPFLRFEPVEDSTLAPLP